MKVYKFMASNYIEAFVRRGTIKIGTAAEYRVPDGFDDGRSDATEMWRLFKRPYKDVRIGDVPALKALFSKDGTADHIIMRIEDDINFLGNAYMFCTSHKITRLMVDKMSSLFGADGCVVISDVREFQIRVDRKCAQLRKGYFDGTTSRGAAGNVNYVNYDLSSSDVPMDPFLKPKRFAWQCEFRLLWAGEEPWVPFVVDVPEIIPLVKPFDLTRWR